MCFCSTTNAFMKMKHRVTIMTTLSALEGGFPLARILVFLQLHMQLVKSSATLLILGQVKFILGTLRISKNYIFASWINISFIFLMME